MSKPTKKPHLLLWFSIPLIMVIGLRSPNKSLSINIYDTYVVFSATDLTIAISVLLGLIGLGYWIIQKTSRKLT
ncbi:hypothetical protein [Formosa algae]|uniref:ABC-type Fe3+ transport system permease subunit n=1 Tax=Formosa algae TaxID=225843 RepID=A0A9X1CD63_9FLAO|nr:hypothetical protein [Formosa algae]MBP1840995.1 ABC-type Fe3+ transport system permease subunit [Formosa algae]MDQ0336108.1 ABC-type Fe3+ transport system permease subunit [Formosa algae]